MHGSVRAWSGVAMMHRVELLAVEHLAIVLVDGPLGVALAWRRRSRVAGSNRPAATISAARGNLVDELPAAAADADDADDDLLVGGWRAFAAEHAGRE